MRTKKNRKKIRKIKSLKTIWNPNNFNNNHTNSKDFLLHLHIFLFHKILDQINKGFLLFFLNPFFFSYPFSKAFLSFFLKKILKIELNRLLVNLNPNLKLIPFQMCNKISNILIWLNNNI